MKLAAILQLINAIFEITSKVQDVKERKAKRKFLTKAQEAEIGKEVVKIIEEMPEPTLNDDLAGVDFKKHRFFERAGGMKAHVDAPIVFEVTSWGKDGLHFAPNKKSIYRNYAFDSNKDLIAQETSSHGHSTPLRKAVKEKGKTAKYILVVDVGTEHGKVKGRSKLAEVK